MFCKLCLPRLLVAAITLGLCWQSADAQDHEDRNQIAAELMQKIGDLEQKQTVLKQRLGNQHPKIEQANSQLAMLRETLAKVGAVSREQKENTKAMLMQDVHALADKMKKLQPHLQGQTGFDEVAESLEQLHRAVNRLQIKSKLANELKQSELRAAQNQLQQQNSELRAQQEAILRQEYSRLVAAQQEKLARMRTDITKAESEVSQQRARSAQLALQAALELEKAKAAEVAEYASTKSKKSKQASDARIDRIEKEVKEIKELLHQILNKQSK